MLCLENKYIILTIIIIIVLFLLFKFNILCFNNPINLTEKKENNELDDEISKFNTLQNSIINSGITV